MNIFIPCTFPMSLKLHKKSKETGVYERKLILHLIGERQAGVQSQLRNTWRLQASRGSNPPASVTASQLSAQFQTHQRGATHPLCEWRGARDFHRHTQLCEWKTHHPKRCKMNSRMASTATHACHAGLYANRRERRSLTQRSRWPFYGIMGEHPPLFSSP